jgi:predicted  nucleic acid-binding Zn-ribbon protein
MSKDTIKSLKKENDELRVEIESMMNDFKKLVQDVKSSEARSTTNAEMASPALDKESVKSLEYLSNEYDDLHRFRNSSKQQMSRLESRLTVLAENVENPSKSIDEAEQYSYAYNVTMLGIPEFSSMKLQLRQASYVSTFSMPWEQMCLSQTLILLIA